MLSLCLSKARRTFQHSRFLPLWVITLINASITWRNAYHLLPFFKTEIIIYVVNICQLGSKCLKSVEKWTRKNYFSVRSSIAGDIKRRSCSFHYFPVASVVPKDEGQSMQHTCCLAPKQTQLTLSSPEITELWKTLYCAWTARVFITALEVTLTFPFMLIIYATTWLRQLRWAGFRSTCKGQQQGLRNGRWSWEKEKKRRKIEKTKSWVNITKAAAFFNRFLLLKTLSGHSWSDDPSNCYQ